VIWNRLRRPSVLRNMVLQVIVWGVLSGAAADETSTANLLSTVQQVSPPLDHEIPVVDPLQLYGGDIVFEVYRKKSKVGEHRVAFARDDGRLTVTAHFSLTVKFLGFSAYAFDYKSTEIWDDRTSGGLKLVGLSANTDDGGKLSSVTARPDGELFRIEGPNGPVLASSWVFPTNHWHRGQVATPTILNTLTGQLANVEVLRKGIDGVATASGVVDAEHFVYTGDLRDTDVWYDSQGRWVKMVFKAKDGSRIEYRCRACGQPGPSADAGDSVAAGGAN
jgi:hypothetical protein